MWSASGLAGYGSSPQEFGVMSDLRGRLQVIQVSHPSNFTGEDTEESKCVTLLVSLSTCLSFRPHPFYSNAYFRVSGSLGLPALPLVRTWDRKSFWFLVTSP